MEERKIFVAYDPCDGGIFCAWTNEEKAKKDCEESGAKYVAITLYDTKD